jgi:hypothetical protein
MRRKFYAEFNNANRLAQVLRDNWLVDEELCGCGRGTNDDDHNCFELKWLRKALAALKEHDALRGAP